MYICKIKKLREKFKKYNVCEISNCEIHEFEEFFSVKICAFKLATGTPPICYVGFLLAIR